VEVDEGEPRDRIERPLQVGLGLTLRKDAAERYRVDVSLTRT
jgi:hypothetical protein